MKKRILSLVLAMMMCISLLPPAVAENVVNSEIVFDFGTLLRGEGDDGAYDKSWNVNGMFGENFTTVAAETASYAVKTTRTDLTIKNEKGEDERFLIADFGTRAWDGKDVYTGSDFRGMWTIEAYLGENATAGYYDVSIRGTKMTSGGTFDVYVDDAYAGEYVSTRNVSGWEFTGKEELGKVYITPDSNKKIKISFRCTAKGYYTDMSTAYDYSRLTINSLSLTPTEYEPEDGVVKVDFGTALRSATDDGLYVGTVKWPVTGIFGSNFTTVAEKSSTFSNSGTRIDLSSKNADGKYEKFAQLDLGRQPWSGDESDNLGRWTISVDMGKNAKEGDYDIFLAGTKMCSAGEFDVYVGGSKVGSYSSTLLAGGWEHGGEVKLGNVHITPDANGKVEITFAVTKNGYYSDLTSTYETSRIALNSLTMKLADGEEPGGDDEDQGEWSTDPIIVDFGNMLRGEGDDGAYDKAWNVNGMFGENFTTVENETASFANKGTRIDLTVANEENVQEKFLIADIGRKPWDGTADSKIGKWTIEVDMGKNARAGYYAVSLRGTKMVSGATFAVYVDGVYAGEYSSNYMVGSGEWIFGGKKDLNTVYVTPDSNKKIHITFAATKNGYYTDMTTPYETARLVLNSLTLTPQPELKELSHKANIHNLPAEMFVGDKFEISANAVMSNDEIFRTGKYAVAGGESTTDKFTVTTKTDNVKIEGVTNDGIFEGELVAIAGGEAIIELCATIRGKEYKTEHKINISETVWSGGPVIVDFGTTVRGEGDDGSYGGLWNLQNLYGSGFTTVKSESTGYTSKGTRTDLDVQNEKGEMESFLIADFGTKVWSGAGDDLYGRWTIEVDLGKGAPAGYYGISLRGTKSADAGIFSVYADGVYVGDYCSTLFTDATTWKFGGEERLNTVYLTPDANGKIKITFAITERGYYKNGSNADLTNPYDMARIYINSLKLTYLEDTGSIAYESIAHTLPKSIFVGDLIDFTANAVMNDGTAYYMGKYKPEGGENTADAFTVSVKTGASAEVSGEVKHGKYSGTIRGTEEGTVVLELTAKVAGTEYKAEHTVTVVEPPKPELTVIELSQDTMKYTDNSVPSADWETKGFELVLDPAKMTTYQSRYTPLNINLPDGSEKLLCQIQTGTQVWPTRANSMFTFKTDIKASGYYNIKYAGARLSTYADCYIYVNGKYAGNFISNDSKAIFADGTMYIAEEKLNTIYLERGTVEISIRPYAMYNWCAFFIPFKVSFVPVDAETVIIEEIETEIPSVIAIGEVLEGLSTVKMSDGTVHYFGPANNGTAIDKDNTVTASDASGKVTVANSTQKAENGKSVFDITGKTEGETTLLFEAVIDGIKTQKEVSIRVENNPIASTTAAPETEEVMKGDVVKLIPTVKLESGRITESTAAVTTYKSLTPELASVEGDKLTAIEAGIAQIEVTTVFNGVTKTSVVEIEILDEGMVSFTATAGGSERIRLTDKENDTVPIFVQAYSNLGRELDMSNAELNIVALTPEFATVDANGEIIPVAEGDARFDVTVMLNGRERRAEITLPVVLAKRAGTYYTPERVAIVRENVAKYDWAKQTANNYKQIADRYVDNLDLIYSLIPSEGIPRGAYMGVMEDPVANYCRYCNVNLMEKYGQFTWLTNPLADPWKVQCPDCKRKFPTNDFGSFYELGLNEYGEFDRQRALDKHAEMFGNPEAEVGSKEYYGYGKGYLKNNLYPEVGDRDENGELKVKTINGGVGLRPGETAETWGVDDGYGYEPRDLEGNLFKAANGAEERHTYIAYYVHFGLWYQLTDYDKNGAILSKAIKNCANAYMYTGDIKYGRVAAILIDRIADFYPDYDIRIWGEMVSNSDGGLNTGKTVGCIWECGEAQSRIECYDMVFDVYDDPSVVNYLKEKSQQIKMRYAKNTASQIRTNIEDGLIRSALEGLRDNSIGGNFGMPQAVNAMGAVVLDSMPETKEWLEYLMAPGWVRSATTECKGGGVDEVLVNTIDGDGMGDEASSYNNTWVGNLVTVYRILAVYDRYQEANLLNHPKFVQMLYSLYPLMLDYYTPQIGDSGSTAGAGHWTGVTGLRDGWEAFADPVFAQVYYEIYGYEGVTYPITVKNPESLEDEIRDVIEEYGTLDLDSNMMTHFGLGILRAGKNYKTTTEATKANTFRNTWMYFGSNSGHGHQDTLNLGMTAFGLNFMPDLGYPTLTGTDPERLQWTSTTLSHNTVMVNERTQDINAEVRGKAKHFSDDGSVQLMDVSTPYVYEETDEYRRSVVTIDIDDSVSYTVDFFRVLGGNDHLYSFHAQSNEIKGVEGLNLVPQADESGNYIGSYAGADVPYGKDPNSPASWDYDTVYPRGYTWLNNVDRDASPDGKFEIDFAIKDFNKKIKNSSGLALHMTMFNGDNLENGASCEVAIADGYPPQKAENKNIDRLKYVLVKNSGENLDTLFTTIFEPYRNTRALASSEKLDMQIIEGSENATDASAALKITHTSGRVDYVFYATNNTATYKVVDGERELSFRGFVGVYTVNSEGKNTYSYVHDGDIIGDVIEGKSAIEGTVKSFTKELEFENEIVITPTEAVSDKELAEIVNRYVFVDNGPETRSGSYKIVGAERRGDDIALDVGRVTSIRKYKNVNEPELGYVYIISEGMPARIPLTIVDDGAPEFLPISDTLSTSAGSAIAYTINATSPYDETITYRIISAPRGAAIDAQSGKITWKPESSQLGDNLFVVGATDASGRERYTDFIVTVYGSTTGGGGGGTTTPTKPSVPDKDEGETTIPTTPSTGSEDETSVGNVRFIDLGNHAWAADSINSLADEEIVKGTTENTYSPGNNITRADFAILLVRAFELVSDDTTNFDDVLPSDYFADELAIARNTGIVNGIGDNKYAPRNTITRQDMMVIVYRALTKLGFELEIADVTYEDFADVADYAKDAVKALITSGLVNGKNGKIAPTDYTTRAEVAVLLKRILEYTSK